MQIKIPHAAVKLWDAIGNWGNVIVVGKLRRLDIAIGIGFVAAVAYGYYEGGPWSALVNGLMFILGGMVGLWFF